MYTFSFKIWLPLCSMVRFTLSYGKHPRKLTLLSLNVNAPYFISQSTVAVAKNVNELHSLMKDLPDYADQFLNMICKVLQEYRETCHGSYKSIVLSDSEEKRIISATWAKDEDIQRFLRYNKFNNSN